MKTKEKHKKVACTQLTNALDIIFSEKYMPDVINHLRARLSNFVLRTERSNPKKPMICIPQSEFSQLANVYLTMLENGDFEHQTPALLNKIRSDLRKLNINCHNCKGCENKNAITKKNIKTISDNDAFLSPRMAKVHRPTNEMVSAHE